MRRLSHVFARSAERTGKVVSHAGMFPSACWLLAVLFFQGMLLVTPLPSWGLDDSLGVHGIHAEVAKSEWNISGTGIQIGQLELGEPWTEHAALAGHVTRRNTGSVSNLWIAHATAVGDILVGRSFSSPELTGVAHGASLYSAGFLVDADFYSSANWLVANDLDLINVSGVWEYTNLTNTGSSTQTLFADFVVYSSDVLWVNSAGNEGDDGGGTIGVPGDGYNLLTVGASTNLWGNYTKVWQSSSRGETGDGRCKPDLVAPGSPITSADYDHLELNHEKVNTYQGTSLAAPHVTGTAALLTEYANAHYGDNAKDHKVLKAVLMNSADKEEGLLPDKEGRGMSHTITRTDGTDWLDSIAY